MLYMPTDAAKPKRLQGCYVSDQETERMVYFWNGQHPDAQSPMLKVEELASAQTAAIGGSVNRPRDGLFDTAMQLAEDSGTISASFLQRKLHIGYPRAARLADEVKEALGQDTDDGGAEIPADDDTLLR
jgi:S-DNA-T family DNA segregation ATPase FtsK/SpoIIIE